MRKGPSAHRAGAVFLGGSGLIQARMNPGWAPA